MKSVISFPRIGNYTLPFGYFVRHVFDAEPLPPPPTTKRTLELGAIHSPDFVCAPFKYNLGSYIECLDAGAQVLIQLDGPCRLGYYGELQEQILRDLGYEFEFINLADGIFKDLKLAWAELKKHNPKLTLKSFAKTLLICISMVEQMDAIEDFIRENVGFETVRGSCDEIYRRYLEQAKSVTSKKQLKALYSRALKELSEMKFDRPKKPLRVGIIGEYYTIMEPYSNHFLERELAAKNICISRRMNISSTAFHRNSNKILKRLHGYVKYSMGATCIDTVNSAMSFAKKGYDGIIHVKSFGCMPEIDAMTVLQNIGADYKIPILYLSFDSQTSETGVQTRLEAFEDMIKMARGQ